MNGKFRYAFADILAPMNSNPFLAGVKGLVIVELIKGVRHTVVFLSISLNCVYGIECIYCGLDTGYAP